MKLFKIITLLLAVLITVFLIIWRPTMPVDLGSGYTYDYDPVLQKITSIFNKNIYIVKGNIEAYIYNSRFIVAEEKSIDTFEHRYNTFNLKNRDKMFDTFSFRQIWVVDKRTDSIYGPYQKAVYKKIKDSLGVPDTLKLQFERHK